MMPWRQCYDQMEFWMVDIKLVLWQNVSENEFRSWPHVHSDVKKWNILTELFWNNLLNDRLVLNGSETNITFGTIICSYFLIGLFSVDNTYLAVCFLCLRYPWCAQTLFCYLYFFSSISELAHKRRLRLFTCYQMITILMSVSSLFPISILFNGLLNHRCCLGYIIQILE